MDNLDLIAMQTERANGVAGRLVEFLKARGFEIAKVHEGDDLTDAEITLAGDRVFVQLPLDGGACVNHTTRQGFMCFGEIVSTFAQVEEEIRRVQAKMLPIV